MRVLREFVCPACWTTDEQFVAADDRNVAVLCPFCAILNYTVRMQRVITAPSIRGETVSRA
jgi:hypothetical protein